MVKGRPGSIVEKLHERNPEPVSFNADGVVGTSQAITVNPWEGFVAEVMFRIRRSDTTAVFEVIDTDGNVLDDVSVSAASNGFLRVFHTQPERPLIAAVRASVPTANFDLTVQVLRHRITGVV